MLQTQNSPVQLEIDGNKLTLCPAGRTAIGPEWTVELQGPWISRLQRFQVWNLGRLVKIEAYNSWFAPTITKGRKTRKAVLSAMITAHWEA